MEFPFVIRATQKSGKPDAFVWIDAKTESRAALMLDVALEDAGIETGRGKDYMKPIRTDFPVFNDLPEEGVVDFTWCERYELADDQRTWQLKDGAAPQDTFHQEDAGDADADAEQDDDEDRESHIVDVAYNLAPMGFRVQLLAQFIAEDLRVYCINKETQAQIAALEMDTDNTYVQNLLLAAENAPEVKAFDMPTLWKLTAAVKTVFPQDKRSELNQVIQFVKAWATTEHIDRGIIVREWTVGNRISSVNSQQQEALQSERHTRAVPQSTTSLRNEIAVAQLYPDAEPGNISRNQLSGAKNLQEREEAIFTTAAKTLMGITDILEYDTLSVFGVTRAVNWNGETPVKELRQQARAWLAENGIYENGEHSKGYLEWDENPRTERQAKVEEPSAKQPEIANVGVGIFSIDGLMSAPAKQNKETTSDEPMEETERAEGEANNAVPAGESAVEDDQQTDTVTDASAGEILAAAAPSLANHEATDVNQKPENVNQNDGSVHQEDQNAHQSSPEVNQPEPVAEYPAFFEPGRYEGLPNEVYHAANGISSTQVKDARVSLMFYHGRHVTKTIRRESSDALTFGSLAHTLALEPEKLHEEFAVFPGIPVEAFTTTDSLKAFIREYNTDKPKADQLKLTGKKEELQEAIRAVNPDAIFADEFEQQWRESVAGKTILTSEQLNLATAIQQALLNHESAGKLLRHPSRAVETSYFGMDEETGLEVRVRPDLEVEVNGVRIGVDLKTISMGRVKQEGLRAKLHREIIDRDYHISAGMYCNVADFDQFFWIFVNKDEGYHWVAVIEASEDLLDLGLLEYQRTMRALAQAYDTDCWPAPVTEDYSDELNDFDLRRLEALRLA
ncbi:RecE family exodeoxyribonuclease [Kluyvera sichuanensis]|uniref:RecE family exodeoxyribonuclease n=1 Tax=Kluyvera sichuanensis TaxID=2725494 RepID=UPI0034A5AE8B